MTKEEAIHFAECLKHNWTIDFNDMEDFCDMAIKALQAEPVVRCKDCRHANECRKIVQYARYEQNTVSMGYLPIEWCSRGERREP